MSKLKLVIVEDNPDMASVTADFFQGLERYDVIGIAEEGNDGINLIRSGAADVALIDLLMPGHDGLYVLEALNLPQYQKLVRIVMSGINNESLVCHAFKKGADYFVIKPFDLSILARRIEEIWAKKTKQGLSRPSHVEIMPAVSSPLPKALETPESFVLRVLHDIPIANTLNGYLFIKTAILLVIEDQTRLSGVTKRLYPDIAKEHQATPAQVERAIRHALDVAWRKGGGHNYAALIGYGDPKGERPTNAAFIYSVAELYTKQLLS